MLPAGYRVGHWTDPSARTGCTVVLPPPGTRGGVDVRGGGIGSRELECLAPGANAEGPTAVLLTGGSAYGLAAADGVMRWCEERGFGRPTLGAVVPLVPAAVVYDLNAVAGSPAVRPGPDGGYAACESARDGVPPRGRVGAGAGTAVGKVLGREHACPGGVGFASGVLGSGERIAVIAVVNAFGDVVGADGSVLAGPRGEDGKLARSAELIAATGELPGNHAAAVAEPRQTEIGPQNTTLVCVCTDAAIDKRGCGIVARIAGAGLARAVDPAFTPIDGDVVFCLASGAPPAPTPGLALTWSLTALGTLAATLVADAIRDAVTSA